MTTKPVNLEQWVAMVTSRESIEKRRLDLERTRKWWIEARQPVAFAHGPDDAVVVDPVERRRRE